MNGHSIGVRYDGTYPTQTYVGTHADMINIAQRNCPSLMICYIRAELETYKVFWNIKTEDAHKCETFTLLELGLSLNYSQIGLECYILGLRLLNAGVSES